jgi:hypothetical protein
MLPSLRLGLGKGQQKMQTLAEFGRLSSPPPSFARSGVVVVDKKKVEDEEKGRANHTYVIHHTSYIRHTYAIHHVIQYSDIYAGHTVHIIQLHALHRDSDTVR